MRHNMRDVTLGSRRAAFGPAALPAPQLDSGPLHLVSAVLTLHGASLLDHLELCCD